MREQEWSTHCETFLPSMSEDFNTCSWSAYRRGGDGANLHYRNGSIRDSYAAADSSFSGGYGYERDFMKQTMLEHEAVFKNQVHELHRLYRVQRKLVDEVKGKNSKEEFSFSDYTSETASTRQLPRYGEGSSSQACNGRLQNGFCSRDGNEVVPVKARRKMIDLQLPADEYLDTDETGDNEEITIFPPFKRSKCGRGDASHQSNSSGSCLDVKNSNGLADLNEPLKCQDSEPVSLSRDMHAHYGRNNADVQGLCLEKNTSQNGWMVLEAGNSRSTHRDQLPSHSAQAFSNNGFQPQNYPTTDHNKVIFPGYRDLEVRSKNPQASYDSHVESSVASNTPRLHNDYRPDFVRPWSHWSSSWENPRSSSHQKSYPVQTNPYMNFVAHARTDSTFEMRSPASNGIYHGFSSGSKEAALNFPSAGFRPNGSVGEVVKNQSFESLQGPKKQERSAGLPWLKPKPLNRSEVSNGFLDLNASTNQSIDGTDSGDGLNSISPQKSLRSSASCSYNANVGRVEMINPHSRKIIGCPIFEQPTIFKEEVNHLVKRDLDINLPCDASVSADQHGTKAFRVGKEEGNKAGNFRHYIDLNSCASEDDEDSAIHSSLRVKTKGTICIDLEAPPTLESEEEEDRESEKSNEETWGLMKGKDGNSLDELIKEAAQAIVAISLSGHQRLPDDAASSSTDAAGKSPLSWFADIITSQGDELERKADHEGDSSGEIDYFEAMTLNLHPTKEEDYMPEPLVPENLIFEVTGSNRPRRGQARRGRPKRDFQRDTLPGLPSLSRHEVNEDIQLFGGLMKSREHTLNSGVAARRNSKRKRIISQAPVCPSMAQPMNESVAVVGLEDSKLTGWGKATRRPRRQRCPPAGNAATVILT